jgi:hypothetical protein
MHAALKPIPYHEAPLSDYLKQVCKIGKGKDCCRYLVGDSTGMHCAKLHPSLKAMFDERIAFGVGIAKGINCEGRPLEDVL